MSVVKKDKSGKENPEWGGAWLTFSQGSLPKGLFMKKMAPMFHLYVKLWCVHFQRIRLCQDKTSSKTGQRWNPPPLLPALS